ncbi:hypothetical protein PVAP13_5NG189405 [Panicum virgatum]|uniref:SWIM-type domain-containing protein n=1 Tax=Panicum virgatum TaxID=38727 RepID=A0A8T0RQT1_PANVG|nr:hypothetical protein PVAP13_5NG189405 [Panicum virgatum]
MNTSDMNGGSGENGNEEEIEEFIRKEQQAASEGNNADVDSKYTPQIGMEFKDRNVAHHFFSFYGFLAGFEVVVSHVSRTSAKKNNNEIYKQEMKCHRYGKQTKKEVQTEVADETLLCEASNDDKAKRKTNVQIRTDCKCVMVVKEISRIWKVIRLDLEHNHELSPKDRNQLFSGKKTLNDNNIPTRKMIAILSYLRGGLTALPYKTKDVHNVRTKINREVTGNDMTQAMEYFRKRKIQDPTFYFRFQVDNDMKVKNIFWREGISLKWSAEYGDCVSFDTTYMTNRYNLPFAPFVGITGHAHTCLLRCAFLSDETVETFKWVFETFVESMGGKHPKSIITDQDKAMKSAIEKVFPNSKHRNCFFHIKSKCYNKNLRCFAINKGLPEKFEDTVNFSEMIAEYKLENNKYFNKMWETRKRFIPSTGRSEGTNARFKDNVGPTYSIVSFLREYQRIVDTIKNKEEIEDNFNKQKTPKEMLYGYTIEQQTMDLYNRNIYIKFSNQLKQTELYKYKETEKGRCFEVWYKANQIKKRERIRKYIVLTDLTEGCEDFSCICGKFNKDGILCAHILKVIVEEEINKIPDKYFIDHWRKKERKYHIQEDSDGNSTHELLRLNKHLDFLMQDKERQTTSMITRESEVHQEIVILQEPNRI